MRPRRTCPSAPRRRRPRPHVLWLAAALSLLATAAPAKDILTVRMDKAKLIKYPPETETIIVGNPIVADVTMLRSSGMLVVTGKGFGDTNLILLDHDGNVLIDADLRVEPSDSLVTVQRGTDRETYACQPRCEPTVTIGDASTFIKDAAGAISARNTAASPAAAQPH
ncbi:MAG TPA: pilus assembly protein N-terminal domain-containing protein [Lichenihabitans sp.]|jgi:Flp pilus assembly secretin CpaC|nr:pilus assembly protein N-terminal domain-containing protein [Lichenihabitans sp.]